MKRTKFERDLDNLRAYFVKKLEDAAAKSIVERFYKDELKECFANLRDYAGVYYHKNFFDSISDEQRKLIFSDYLGCYEHNVFLDLSTSLFIEKHYKLLKKRRKGESKKQLKMEF